MKGEESQPGNVLEVSISKKESVTHAKGNDVKSAVVSGKYFRWMES